MRFHRLIALCLPLLTACASPTLPPDLAKESLGLPDTFRASGTEMAEMRWWRSFNDPQMDRLVLLALQDSPDLQATLWRLQQSAAAARGARAGFWPRLTGRLENTEQRRADGDFDFEGSENEGNTWSGRLAASYEVDLWGRVRAGSKAAEADYLAQEQNLQTAALSLAAEVSIAWLELREQWGQRDLLAQQLEINRQTLQVLEMRFGRGVSAAADVLQQRQLVQQSEQELQQAEADIETLKVQLAALLGISVRRLEPLVQTAPGMPSMPALPDTGVPGRLLLRRPDVQQAQRELLADYYSAEQAWADRLPVISLSAVASGGGPAISDIVDDWLLTLTAAVEGVIFDGGQLAAAQEQADAALQERWALYRGTVIQALSEVEQALIREQAVLDRLRHLRERERLADMIVERQRRNYARGTVDFLNVLTATNSQQSLARQILTAQRELLENRVTLYRALSGGLPWEDLPAAEPVELELYRTGELDA
ncbi:efflux transporter outer membrane subunit [Microbulbifer thermotolerans]|uniref:efflux transporter outer membrane subunit n=1 Tax=Microbulbifer thermotolerans TaxID=252514 RepID=UPI00224912FA|nr:efflux transporter outer membrane subunit [Microbulbifer thermotolerans]MCX2780970.1 efflux transporter outer membrane subunit [Microbulbifer thermotolerans]MCX2806590.1 efflux transporter outer membrane subunit [Microbulbifer thermotolerans]MCX2832717.1 efflux transporter outer membrane subunit [Microbulbifer thermotolerans]